MILNRGSSRRRPVPHNFTEAAAHFASRNALAMHYRTGADVVERWFRETGLPIPVYYRRLPVRTCAKCDNEIKRDSKTGLCLGHYHENVRAAREAFVPSEPKIFLADIIAHTAAVFGISASDIRGPKRFAHICGARFVVCYLGKTQANQSYPIIGGALGGRDHSSIMHGRRKCENYMARFPDYARKVATVRWLAEGGERLAPQPKPIVVERPEWIGPRATYHYTKSKPVEAKERPWWELSDDELIAQRIAEYRRAGGDFVEVF